MSEFNITVEGGSSVRLPTAGKYVDRDIIVTAEGGSEDLDSVLTEQEALIQELQNILAEKAVGTTTPDNTSEYQRVEYITSAEEDTYPYIITDFVADNTCGLEVIASFPILQDRIPMGSRLDSGTTRFYCVYPLSATSCYYGFNGGYSVSCSTSINTIYRLQTNFLNSRLVNIYDENGNRKASASISSSLTQQTCPVAIFGYNYAMSETVTSKREYKLYGARCSRGNEVVREYIPCYRKSDGVVGLYEKFTGEFLTDENGILFTKGADMEWGYIGDGIIPEGTLDITENGTYDVTEYATANVNVPTGGDTDFEDSFINRTLSGDYINDRVTKVGQFTFRGCTKITSLSFPKATSVGTNAFYGCNKLTEVNMPLVKTIGDNTFNGCSILSSIILPSLTSGGSYMFRYCYLLLTIDLPVIKNIVANMFGDCRRLTAVILRSPTMCTLASTSGFYNCYHFHGTVNSTYNPEGLKDGYIYVPSALVDSYKTATNWSTFASQFRAIEDYPEITGG